MPAAKRQNGILRAAGVGLEWASGRLGDVVLKNGVGGKEIRKNEALSGERDGMLGDICG